jgi:PAS domain S-box-containing protein
VKRQVLTSAVPPLAFEQVLDALNDPVLASDESGRVLYLNAAAERLLGWPTAELLGKPLTTIMPPRLRPAHEQAFQRFMTTGRSTIIGRPIRVAALHRSGTEIDVELTLSELRPETGRLLVVAVIRDLRERVELEMKVDTQRKILAQYATVAVLAGASDAGSAMPKLLEAAATALDWEVGIYWARDPASNRLAISAAWSSGSSGADGFLAACRSMTFGPGEGLPGTVLASGRAEWSRDVRSDRRYLRSQIAIEHGLRSALVFPVYTPDRTWGVLEYLSKNEEGVDDELRQTMTVLGFQIGQFLARMENEEKLRRALARAEAERRNLETLFEDAPAAIAIVRGPEMRYELSNAINQALAAGRQLVGRTVREALPELEADGVFAMIGRVYETGEPFLAREYPVMAPGEGDQPAHRMFMNGVCQPLRGAHGEIEGVMIFAYDVTDLVTARHRVEEAEERLRLAVESAEVGTWDYDPQTGVVQCDTRFRRLFGLGPDGELTTKELMAAIRAEDRPGVDEAARRSFDPRTGGTYAAEYRAVGIDDGIERWVSVRGRTFFDEGGKPRRFVGTGADITAQKIALERERFLAEASTILASSLDYRATLTSIARLAVPRLADWCSVELAAEGEVPEQIVIEHVNPAKVELARALRRRYPPDPRSRSGVLEVLRTGRPMFVPEVTDEMLSEGGRDAEHVRILRELGLRSAILLPLKIRDGTVGVLGLFQAESGRHYTTDDLTFAGEVARRAGGAVENARLYDQAKRAVGVRDQFLSIASHELRTPLTSLTLHLSSFSRMAAAGAFAGLPSADKLEGRIARMQQQAGRLAALVDELLNVSRIATGRLALDRQPMDLVEVVKEVLDRLGEEADRAGSTLTLHAPNSLTGRWDRNRLDQVVTNLVVNAIKYASGKPIDVDLARGDGTVQLAVRDQGPGISEGDQQRIFEQFERAASPVLAGFGLGLWIARSIVEAHGGRIGVASTLGAGATFTVELPDGPH